MPLELPDDIRRSVTQATAVTAPGITARCGHCVQEAGTCRARGWSLITGGR
ncbi:hypothetical protein ACLB9X_23430 [Streptomyces sp. 5K101]|uniref:hypothetical protein n=1 Tax=Streptomyces sp. 5K101 TaxID=3390037 RepID=UPI0039770F77